MQLSSSLYAQADLIRVYKAILDATSEIAKYLRRNTPKRCGTYNPYGDEQTDGSLKAQEIIFTTLQKCDVIKAAMSKENPKMKTLNEKGEYIVTFVPLDGSTVIEANYSVASLFSIWNKEKLDDLTGRDLVGSALSVYGSRTSVLTHNVNTNQVEELSFIRTGLKERWVTIIPKLTIQPKSKNFSPEGVKTTYENPTYLKIFHYYCVNGYSIRYSSSISNDCYQMFIRKGGIYISLESETFGTKLTLLFDSIPISFLIEKAGGIATNGKDPILDQQLKGVLQRTQLIAGSKDEVEFVVNSLANDGSNLRTLEQEASVLKEQKLKDKQ